MKTTAERLAAAMTEPTGTLWTDLGLDKLRDVDKGFGPAIDKAANVYLRLRATFGAESSVTNLFVPPDVTSRALTVRPTGGAARLVSLVQSVPVDSEQAIAAWYPDLQTSGLPAFTASGSLLPIVGSVTNNVAADRLQRFGFATDPFSATWVTSNGGKPFETIIEPLLAAIWASGLAAQITSTSVSQAAQTVAYSSGSTTSLIAQAVARVQEAAYGPHVVVIASAGAAASLRKDAVAAGSSLAELVPDAEVVVVPSALLPAAGTVLVLDPTALVMFHDEHDSAVVSLATADQATWLAGQVTAQITQRLALQLLQPKAAAMITGLTVVS